MASWINRARAARDAGAGEALQRSGTGLTDNQSINSSNQPQYNHIPLRVREPNCPDHRLQLNSKCIYERRLPGNAYITCHVDRLQCGFYDSPNIHEDPIEHVRFLTLHFVFHPSSTINRFTGATIRVSVRNAQDDLPRPPGRRRSTYEDAQLKKQSRQNPSIIRHAPHLLYGSISPETLQWNFNMAGTLGVSQGPANASLSPSGGVKSSYKRFEMMKIQGSIRTYAGNIGPDDDVEDGEVVWTLEENRLQKSGLPREFTFVILLQKGDPELETAFAVHVDPVVSSSFGHYPNWYMGLIPYRPLPKPAFDLDHEIGQKFEPTVPGRGYNFANLAVSFEDFISLPGTTYSATDPYGTGNIQNADTTKTPISQSLQNSLVLGQAAKLSGPGVPSQSQPPQAPKQTQDVAQTTYQHYPNHPQPPLSSQHFPQQSNPHARAASVPPPQSYPWPAPASLFPNNTLNVRVYVEKAAAAGRSPSRVRDVSARRPHSLRHSRSREGLVSEYSTIAAEDAAHAYMQTNRSPPASEEGDALKYTRSSRKSSGHVDRNSFEDPNLAQSAALAHIQSTRRSMSSAGRNSYSSTSNRGSMRKSLAEEMREMEARIRELTELEKQKKARKDSPPEAFEYLDIHGNGLERKELTNGRPRSTPARNRWSSPPSAFAGKMEDLAAPPPAVPPPPPLQTRETRDVDASRTEIGPIRRAISSSVPPTRNGFAPPSLQVSDTARFENTVGFEASPRRRRNSLGTQISPTTADPVEREISPPRAAELANGLLKDSLSGDVPPDKRRVSASVPPARNSLPLPGEKRELETGVYKDPPPTPQQQQQQQQAMPAIGAGRRRYSVGGQRPSGRVDILAAIDKEVESGIGGGGGGLGGGHGVLAPKMVNGSSPLRAFVFPDPKAGLGKV